MTLVRFGVSLDDETLNDLDNFVQENKLPNRSQGIRHLINKNQVEKKWLCNNIVAGAIVLVYNYCKTDIISKTTLIQHENYDVILSSQLFHLNKNNCLEIIAIKGEAQKLTKLADQLIGIKGVIHGKLVMSKAD
ncbi:MAG: nickel-responsive transcriptional regulator NikR [Marinilabiliaceae bacterium]|nr:nickel-responsive transcriptional regulator NikR [Marinilabiliaceae bacterium]